MSVLLSFAGVFHFRRSRTPRRDEKLAQTARGLQKVLAPYSTLGRPNELHDDKKDDPRA